MLRLLLSIATFVVAYATDCPDGTELVAQGVNGYSQSYSTKPDLTIDECKAYCDGLRSYRCLAFTFDPTGYDQSERSMCKPFRFRFVRYWYPPQDPRFSDQILCAYPAAVECPEGTLQVGEQGAFGNQRIGGSSIFSSAAQCEQKCRSTYGCKSFTYNPHGFNRAFCTMFSSDTEFEGEMSAYYERDGNHYHDQILCKLGPSPPPPECPDGTKQIGMDGYYFRGSTSATTYGVTIDVCKDYCSRYSGSQKCTAFEYDADWGRDEVSRSRCKLFITRFGKSNHPYTKDQIICGVQDEAEDEPKAQSSGLFNLDGVSVVHGNEQVMGVSVNIIYIIIIGLMCVNIVCLMAYCWRNMKKNKRKYKVVSMRSDYETENDV